MSANARRERMSDRDNWRFACVETRPAYAEMRRRFQFGFPFGSRHHRRTFVEWFFIDARFLPLDVAANLFFNQRRILLDRSTMLEESLV